MLLAVCAAATLVLVLSWTLVSSRRGGERSRPLHGDARPGADSAESSTSSSEPEARGEVAAATDVTGVLFHGTVFDPSGRPSPAGVVVRATLAGVSKGPVATTETNGGGAFLLEASRVAGSWSFMATAWGGVRSDPTLNVVAVDAGRGLLSRASSLVLSQAGKAGWIPMRLLPASRVRATITDSAGEPVPDAICWILQWPERVEHAWDNTSWRGDSFACHADAGGELLALIAPGRVRLWARAADGVFGPSAGGSLGPGETLDLGRVVVPAERCVHRLRVVDPSGRALGGVGIRLDAEHSVQRLLSPNAGDDVVHYHTTAEGVADLELEVGGEPITIAFAASGYGPVVALLAHDAPGSYEHEVRLSPALDLGVRLLTPGDEGLPADFSTVCWELLEGERGGGGGDLPGEPVRLGAPSRDASPSAETLRILAQAFSSNQPRSDDDGRYVFSLARPGRYRVRASLPPGVHAQGEAEVGDAGAPDLVLRIPEGRRVFARVAPQTPNPTTGYMSVADPRAMYVWAATVDLPASDWPANRREAIDATLLGSRIRNWVDEDLVCQMWLPNGFTHVAFRRFREQRVAEPPALSVAAGARPGAVRYADQARTIWDETARVAVPDGENPRIDILDPSSGAQGEGQRVELRVAVDGAPLRERGIELVVREVGSDAGSGRPLVARVATQSDGVARLRIPAGTYVARVSPHLGPKRPVTFVVMLEPEPVEVVVPFLAHE
jgi:hypothetical protein